MHVKIRALLRIIDFIPIFFLTNPFGCPIFHAVFVIVLLKALKGSVHLTNKIVMNNYEEKDLFGTYLARLTCL